MAFSTDLIVPYALAAVLGYLIGSIPTGYIVVKQLTGQDIRQIGSGGTGATNVRRAAGGKAALFVLFFDLHKGLVPVILAKQLFPGDPWLHVLVALAAVVGHSKSVFLNFAGGKSAATGLGGMLGLAFLPALLVGLIAFLLVKLTRYQSVGSILASATAPFLLYLFNAPIPYVIYATVAAAYVILLHRANIGRLLSGTENRLS
jgi:glycerol-3-phosphate acyltransferase PlsY